MLRNFACALKISSVTCARSFSTTMLPHGHMQRMTEHCKTFKVFCVDILQKLYEYKCLNILKKFYKNLQGNLKEIIGRFKKYFLSKFNKFCGNLKKKLGRGNRKLRKIRGYFKGKPVRILRIFPENFVGFVLLQGGLENSKKD